MGAGVQVPAAGAALPSVSAVWSVTSYTINIHVLR